MAALVNHRYQLVRPLGRGQQGSVWLATDEQLGGAERALKFVGSPEGTTQLFAEFEQLRVLSHTGLARAYAIESVNDLSVAASGHLHAGAGGSSVFVVSEFIGGPHSREHASKIPKAHLAEMLLAVAEQVASALSHLHARSWVHADVKPENLRWAPGNRIVLLDLGLSRRQGSGDAAGTPRYMAPEALSGYLDARSDLYSLGATLVELASGRALYPEEQRPALVASILAGRAIEAIGALIPSEVPRALVELIAKMLAPDPLLRPSGARALLGHLARIREATGLGAKTGQPQSSANFAHPEYVGRSAERDRLRALLNDFDAVPEPVPPIVISGPPGSGRRRLVEEALLAHQMQRAARAKSPLVVHLGSKEKLWPARHELARKGPAVLLLCDDTDADLARLRHLDTPAKLLLILCLPAESSSADPSNPEIALRPLSRTEATQLARSLALGPCPDPFSHRVHTLSRGWPGPIRHIMSVAATLDPSCAGSPDTLLAEENIEADLTQRIARLGRASAQLLEELAVAGRPLAMHELHALSALDAQELPSALDALLVSGFLVLSAGRVACISTQQGNFIDSQLPSARRRSLHRRCLQILDKDHTPTERARHLLITGPKRQASAAALRAIAERRDAGRLDQALDMCIASESVVVGNARVVHAIETAELALASGRYPMALDFAKRASRAQDFQIRTRSLRAIARAHQHVGAPKQAAECFAKLLEEDASDSESRARLARCLLAQGELEAARKQAERALDASQSLSTRAIAMEAMGLVHLYGGQVASAADVFAELAAQCSAEADDTLLGRARGLQGMCAQKQGKLSEAADFYGEAHILSARAGAWHAASVFLLNRATVQQRSAQYALALDSLAAALPGLVQSHTPLELAAAYCNRGNLLLMLGEVQAAQSAAQSAGEYADAAAEPRLQFFANLLHGDIDSRIGNLTEARRHFESALVLAESHSLADKLHAELRLIEHRAQAGEEVALEASAWPQGDSHEQRAESLASRARVALKVGATSADLAEELAALQEVLRASDDLDLGWRVAVLHARMRVALAPSPPAPRELEQARQLFEIVLARCPEAYRGGLRDHPDARSLTALVAASQDDNAPAAAETGLSTRVLLSLSRRLNSELRLEPLLDEIIDAAIELSRAERAFLLLRSEGGELEVKVARNMDREDLRAQSAPSRSIAETVAQTGEVVMTVDAESDTRFGASLSVSALRLRSILAVPFRVKSRVVGTLYLDHRFRRGAFNDGAVELVRELADIAAIAIENARLITENRQKQLENEALTARLEASLEDTEAELASTRAKLPHDRPQQAFATIIGGSTALRDVLVLAERAAASSLSVVIAGESGTGKELLARAIHQSSDRRTQAFVALNCGAVPDSLLESELFGHQKGAFTGADRGRRGLFQVADRGTLFLDEIADTSLAMQSKLLRALQEGEIRPLGCEESRHVDVRIICASNRPLTALVATGEFREDLFYRLHVMALTLPPLRERAADIEPLARHILATLKHPSGISAAAIATLQAHSWPGNVRELENELTRACAMAEAAQVQPEHLRESLQREQERREEHHGESLLLKPRVERLERDLIEEAMRETGGNQSKAALLLGLSRYGLQKKLIRYSLTGQQNKS